MEPGPLSERYVSGLLAATEVAIESGIDTPERLDRLCEIARTTVGCSRSSIFLRRDDGRFHASANAGNPPDVAARFASYSMGPQNPFIRELSASRQIIVDNDVRHRPGMRTLAEVARIHGLAVAPIADGADLVGFLTIEQNEEPVAIDRTSAAIAQGLANVAWQVHTRAGLRLHSRDLMAAELIASQRMQRIIADRLHDGPLQVFVSLSLRLQLAAADASGSGLEDELWALSSHSSVAGARLRDLILNLDSLVGQHDLSNAIRTLAGSYETSGGWRSTVHCGPGVDDVSESIAFVVERLVQAALTDARDRARPDEVEVDLRSDGSELVVTVDYEVTTDVALAARDSEFLIVAERVAALEGHLDLMTEDPSCVRIRARIPLTASASER